MVKFRRGSGSIEGVDLSWRTNSAILLLRSAGRILGINRLVASLRGGGYEGRFQAAMLGAIRPGDVVWDVGANIGFYSTKFSDIAGPSGRIFACEPSPENRAHLIKAVKSRDNITVLPFALGEHEDLVRFEQGADSLGATSRIVEKTAQSVGTVEVRVANGDQIIDSGEAAFPNVIKIDTEGFELEVLRGLVRSLRRRELRTLCIEVHFSLLKDRGLPNAPADIEELLELAGFNLTWPDPSHIFATRSG